MTRHIQQLTKILYELGTLRKIARSHRQMLLTDDLSDNIASHTYRVTMIGWFLAKMEKADPYKTVMMCLLHDMAEARSGDHNWVHKRYVYIHEEEIEKEQLGTLPYGDLKKLIDEYEERKSKEAIIAKDADLLDQVLLLREYEWQGNKEAGIWLRGKSGDKTNAQLARLKSVSAKKLGAAIYKENPSDWWNNIWTPDNRNK
jgi:putative hydrolases of HD superfamily